MKGEEPEDLRPRTKRFGLGIIKLFPALPRSTEAQVMGRQLLRSATSVGAQYREACRARSKAEFISKLESVLQELDESAYWLEMIDESGIYSTPFVRELWMESEELIRILVTIVKRTKCT